MQRLEAIGCGIENRHIGAFGLGEFILAMRIHRLTQAQGDIEFGDWLP